MSSAGHILLAANPLNLELIGASLALFGLILMGALAMVWAELRWKRPAAAEPPPPQTPEDYLALYEQGIVSKNEYERIRTHLQKKLRAAPPAAETSTGSPEAPPNSQDGEGATSG